MEYVERQCGLGPIVEQTVGEIQILPAKAKKSGRPATVGQLNAHDRRIVHLALKADQGVMTRSVGNGFHRKLVVLPKKRKKSRREKAAKPN